jgi:hypothetical protein
MSFLRLDYNFLTGPIPSSIGHIQNKALLYLHFNSLTGTIPVEIGTLSAMSSLYLHYNSLTGTIPTQLGDLTEMVMIYLNSNSLTGTIPSELGKLTLMNALKLESNSLNGTMPTTLENCVSLNVLEVQDNLLTGDKPTYPTLATLLTYSYEPQRTTDENSGSGSSITYYVTGKRLKWSMVTIIIVQGIIITVLLMREWLKAASESNEKKVSEINMTTMASVDRNSTTLRETVGTNPMIYSIP